MFATCPTLVVVPHADAGDRTVWTKDQDLRPLSQLGRQQAAALAAAVGTVDAVFSSPARRCTETVSPIAAASHVDIVEMDELREVTYVTEHEPWTPWAPDLPWPYVLAAAGVGRVTRAVAAIAGRVPTGRVAVCAHGDLVPAFAAFAAAYVARPVPDPIARGGCYEIDLSGEHAGVRARGALLPKPAAS
jgi:broad specificity phosphatase PhoE